MTEKLQYKMYSFVPYQLKGIQGGIQCLHANQEFNNYFIDMLLDDSGMNETTFRIFEAFNQWRTHDKTFIALNGGTTNTAKDVDGNFKGSLNVLLENLKSNSNLVIPFYESDLGDQLTAFVFLVDERVWNKEKYPTPITITDEWIESIGGNTNYYLRQTLPKYQLAT